MVKFLCIVTSILVVSPMAHAQIYKCAGKGGLDLYQNFPCSIDSIGWKPGELPSDKPISTMNRLGKDRSAQTVSESVDAPKQASQSEAPTVGMSADQVRAIWGEPAGDAIHGVAAVWSTTIGDTSVEIWTYGATRTVQFDQAGQVSMVRK